MKHTFLYQEGVWKANGIFSDENRQDIEINGQMDIRHEKNSWIAESFLEMQLKEPVQIMNRYQIDVPETEQPFLPWTALNMVLGPTKGHFVVVGDTIFSLFQTSDGQRGSESFRKIDDQHYHNKGFLIENDKVVSRWEIGWKKNSAE